MKRTHRQLLLAATALCAWAPWLGAGQIRNDITGLMDDSDSNCPSPVPVFDQDDCSYNASDPTGRGLAEWIGPLFNAGYYVPGAGPRPNIAAAGDPVPNDGKTPPPLTGTVDIEDQGTATGTDDTITATIVIGTSERNFGAGARGTAVETWSSLTLRFGPVVVSSATANANGGFDYVIGDHGMPAFLVDAATGTDVWPSESGSDADSRAGDPNDVYWAAPIPVGIAPIENNVRGVASIGTTATLATTGYSCDDGPPNNGDGIGGTKSACDAEGRLGGAGDFENVILSLSTDAAGNITAATLIWVQEQDVVAVMAGFDSWVAGAMAFTGVHRTCGATGIIADDTYTTSHDSTGNILMVGANDTGVLNPVTATLCASPDRGGTATIENSPGDPLLVTVNYAPAPGFTGTETFQYTMDDGTVVATGTVTIEVVSLVAENDAANVIEGEAVDIDVTANDAPGAGLLANHVLTITRQPNVGSVTVTSGNHVTYSSVPGSHGNDNFEYTLTDEDGEVSDPATVQVGIGVAREPTPAGGVSALGPWDLAALAGLLACRKCRRRRAF